MQTNHKNYESLCALSSARKAASEVLSAEDKASPGWWTAAGAYTAATQELDEALAANSDLVDELRERAITSRAAACEAHTAALAGTGTWDAAYETLVEALRTVYEYVERRGLKPDGDSMMIYTGADDTGFEYKAAVPVIGPFDNPPKGDLAVGQAPSGKAYKFVHRGAYDGMENLYEAITNFLDEKNIQPGDFFIERYVTDPRNTPEDDLVIEVIFPVK